MLALRHLWLIVFVYSTTSPATHSGVFQTKHQLTKSTPDTEIKVPSAENPELTNIIGGSCHKYHFCRDKTRLLSRPKYACRNKIMFFDIKVLSRSKCVCRNKTFVATSILLSRQKTCFDTCGSSRQWKTNGLPLNPGLGQNLATHASCTARNFFLALISIFLDLHFLSFLSPSPLPAL